MLGAVDGEMRRPQAPLPIDGIGVLRRRRHHRKRAAGARDPSAAPAKAHELLQHFGVSLPAGCAGRWFKALSGVRRSVGKQRAGVRKRGAKGQT